MPYQLHCCAVLTLDATDDELLGAIEDELEVVAKLEELAGTDELIAWLDELTARLDELRLDELCPPPLPCA